MSRVISIPQLEGTCPMINTLRRLALGSLFASLALPLHAAGLPSKVEQSLKANKISTQSLSLVTVPLNGPGSSTFFNADISVNPASTMKLVTTYAALELLGPTHQWKTEFFTDGQLKNGVLNGNLYLKGGGDPKLNMEKLWLMMRDLRANGVLQVTGDLVLDRSHFVQPQLPSFNDDGGDANKPFLVAPDSLLVNLKALRFIARTEGGKVHIAAEPPIANIRIDNRVKALPAAKCPGWPDVRYNPVTEFDGTKVIVTGQLAEGCSSQTYLSLLDQDTEQGAVALRDLLRLYCRVDDAVAHKQIEGLRSVTAVSIVRRLPLPGPVTYGRGLQISVSVDESAFEGTGAWVQGSVLEQFIAKYVSLNAFTETRITSTARGVIMQWPARVGRCEIL